jgi:drug/metabolite transporter superfamily protein YnfA
VVRNRQKYEMVKIIKADVIVAAIVVGAWLFYFTFDGATRYDVNQTITLPLFVAAWLTAVAAVYAIGRYYKAKQGELVTETVSKLMQDQQPEKDQHEAKSDSMKS